MKKVIFLPLIILLLLMAVSAPGTAFAASNQQVHMQAHQAHAAALLPMVTCSGNGCTGLDPVQTGCSASASTVLSKGIFNGSQRIGTINLRFSSVCQTNWAQIVSSIGPVQFETFVIRASGVDGSRIEECEPNTCGTFITDSSAFTNMVWAPDVPTSATGVIAGNFGDVACVTQDQNALPC
ncbi:MAG TPA: DUF2690 domain-containing protein [Ktedonobacteraceae bacterium]|nr:DUF2690 domain-containing protein [Ktedonobacteraceae bacterium]